MPLPTPDGPAPAADVRPAGHDGDAPRPRPLDAALGELGNVDVQRSAHDGALAGLLLRQAAGPLGNQAVMRMLAVMRHKGSDKKEDEPHTASEHASVEDQREHDREAQKGFDDLDSKGCFKLLTQFATKESAKIMTIPLEALPPALQALVRHIQSTITELEVALAEGALEDDEEGEGEERLRDHIRAGARSWHDDSPDMLPAVDPKKTRSKRGDFFTRWRAEDAAGGRDTTNKQEKNLAKTGGKSSLLPHREYTAVGWKEADQLGRLIYDPIEDQFYLSITHYQDVYYFRIVAPRPKAADPEAPLAARANRWDIEFLIYRAWERLAEELAELGGAEEEEAEAEEEAPSLTAENAPDALACVTELVALRRLYQKAHAECTASFERLLRQWEKDVSVAEKMRALHKPPPKEPGAKPKPLDVNAPFQWCGMNLCVNADNGYIGYTQGKAVMLPGYSTSAKLRDVAMSFRNCVAANALVGPIDDVVQALAALVAEPSRHPPALMEAVFALLEVSPIADRKAFGKGNSGLPMAAGGTDATGGVPTRVLRQESALGLEVIIRMLTTHAGLSRQQIADLLIEVAETKGAAAALEWVEGILRAALMGEEAQQAEIGRLSPPRDAPRLTSLLTQPLSPASPPSTITIPLAETETETAVAVAVADEEGKDEEGPMTPEAVRGLFGGEVEGDFWDGYDDFRFSNPGLDYVLTSYQVLAYVDRTLDPFAPRELTSAEERKVTEFIQLHPEFMYWS